MTMVQVAEVVGVHETTVSRAVSAKYIDTPQGIFEMKYFFTSGIQTSDGVGMSNKSVKDMIAEMFRQEDPAKPLSDQEIVKMLERKRHRDRPPHCGEIPRGTEYSPVELAEGLLKLRRSSRHAPTPIFLSEPSSPPGDRPIQVLNLPCPPCSCGR